MAWFQRTIEITCPKSACCYLATGPILSKFPELRKIKSGVVNFHLDGPGGSLSINENADPTVRTDMDGAVERMGKKGVKSETKDRLAFKSALFGQSLTLPVSNGSILFGTWQGIYLCSWDTGNTKDKPVRKLIVTAFNDPHALVKHTTVRPPKRGVHDITGSVVQSFGLSNQSNGSKRQKTNGAVFVMVRHTSASMGLSAVKEKARTALDNAFDSVVPSRWNEEFFIHTYEGPDDMPGHVKSSLFGVSAVIPVTNGNVDLPSATGLVLGEHRDYSNYRKVAGVAIRGEISVSKEICLKKEEAKGAASDLAAYLAESMKEIGNLDIGLCTLIAKAESSALAMVPKELSEAKSPAMTTYFCNLTSSQTGLSFAGKSLTIPISKGRLQTGGQTPQYLSAAKGGEDSILLHVLVMGSPKK